MTGLQLVSAVPTACRLLQSDAGGGASSKAPSRDGFFHMSASRLSRRNHHSVRQGNSTTSTDVGCRLYPFRGKTADSRHSTPYQGPCPCLLWRMK